MEPNGFEIVPYYMESNNNNQKTGVKMKHTEGQWVVQNPYHKTGVRVSKKITKGSAGKIYYQYASIADITEGEFGGEQEANANLIALAPEMFDALNNILNYFSEYEDDYNEKLECFENARKVIDRAEEK